MRVLLRKRKGKRGTSLFLAWWANNKWNYEFLKLRLTGKRDDRLKDKETERLAEKIRVNTEEELERAGRGIAPMYKRKLSILQYFDSVKKDGTNWTTCRFHLKAFPTAHVAISQINEEWAEKFKEFLLTRISANTAFVVFGTIKATINQAVKEKIILQNPARMIAPIKRKGYRTDYLTAAEVKTLADTPCTDMELKRAFLFCCYTGLRFSDVRGLKWENYQDGMLQYRQKKTGGYEYLSLPEGGPAEKLLNANRSFLPSIFKLCNEPTTNKHLRKWAAAAGIKRRVYFHMSRHTAATLMLESGADLYTVSKVLGHSDIRVTQRYAKVSDQKKNEALANLPDISIDLEKPAADEPKVVAMGSGNE